MFIKNVLKSLESPSRFESAINEFNDYLITTKDAIIRVVDTIALKKADVN